jgi:threonine dehydrogenase-like Zn-dependent dehydrogenase
MGNERQRSTQTSVEQNRIAHQTLGPRLVGEGAMKAFVMKKIGEVGFMDKPVPRPGPNDAVVRTTRALICTSDTHTVAGGIGPRENLTLGHEAVGVVAEVGSEVRAFRLVTGFWSVPSLPSGATRLRKAGTRHSRDLRSGAGSSRTPRTGSLPSTST